MDKTQSIDPDAPPAAAPEQPVTTHTVPAGMVAHYDRRNLEQLIAVGFTTAELVELGGRLGVTLASRASPSEIARALVRAFAQRGDLGALVERLKKENPLMVWPEPQLEPAAYAPGSSASPERPQDTREAAPASMAPPSQAPPSRPAPAESHPLDDRDEDARVWRRALFLTTTLVSGLAGGALATYFFFVPREAEPKVEEDAPTVGVVAATIVGGRVDEIAKVCRVQPTGESVREVLALAFRRCSTKRKGVAKANRQSRLFSPPPPRRAPPTASPRPDRRPA
ncbi:MAG: hypothetical protein AAGA56_26610, partial [Myxococcota bacterium]